MDQITFSKAIDGYLIAANARRLSAHTLADYSTTFRKPAQHLKTDPPIASITVNQVRTFLAAQRGISKKTLLNMHNAFPVLPNGLVSMIVSCHANFRNLEDFGSLLLHNMAMGAMGVAVQHDPRSSSCVQASLGQSFWQGRGKIARAG